MMRNAEGYPDPTMSAALERIIREERLAGKAVRAYRPLVYICSPYAGDIENNVSAARDYCRFAVGCGCIPLAAHLLYPQFMNDADPEERKLALFFGKILMDKCDEVWVFGKTMSPGMKAEHDRAVRRGSRVRYFTQDCTEVKA